MATALRAQPVPRKEFLTRYRDSFGGNGCQASVPAVGIDLPQQLRPPNAAAAELAEARRLSGDDRYSRGARLEAVALKTRALFETTFFAGLRKAAMPVE
jgi:hypothetical protein